MPVGLVAEREDTGKPSSVVRNANRIIALLEGCAPNPFWVHGEISVELDLRWPLPNASATISLTWGGDDGSIPTAPLALSNIDATLVDHTDTNDKPAIDHYVLLAHRRGGRCPTFLCSTTFPAPSQVPTSRAF